MDSLPNELLLDIFRYQNYHTLKLRLPLVCRRFYSVLSDKSLCGCHINRTLFRDRSRRPPPSVNPGYTTHPAFRKLSTGRIFRTLDDVSFYATPGKERIKLIDTPVAHENAISPAVDEVVIIFTLATFDPQSGPRCRVTRGSGQAITVLGVMSTVVNALYDEYLTRYEGRTDNLKWFGVDAGWYPEWKMAALYI